MYREIGFHALDHEILTNRLELIANVRVISFCTPFPLKEFEGLFKDFGRSDDAGIGGCGEAEVRSFKDLGSAYKRFIIGQSRILVIRIPLPSEKKFWADGIFLSVWWVGGRGVGGLRLKRQSARREHNPEYPLSGE